MRRTISFVTTLPYQLIFLSDILHMSKTEIGLLSSGMLIAYGLSKGFMSSLADKASPANLWLSVLFAVQLSTFL